MTPKEKAEELLLKYLKMPRHKMFNGWWNKIISKQCALIAVDEIINSNPHSNPLNTHGFSTMAYWKEVKQEIEKL
jgi:hypothetical protein